MKNENEGIELSIIKGIAGMEYINPAIKRSLCFTLHDLLFTNYLNGKAKYKIDKLWCINIESVFPYVSGVKYIGRSRTKRRHAKSRGL